VVVHFFWLVEGTGGVGGIGRRKWAFAKQEGADARRASEVGEASRSAVCHLESGSGSTCEAAHIGSIRDGGECGANGRPARRASGAAFR